MTARGLRIDVDGTLMPWPVDTHKDIAQCVGGNFDWSNQSDIICYCYEYALRDCQVNPIATAIYRRHNRTDHPLAGPVLIMGPADAEGNETDCPWEVEEEARAIRARLGRSGLDELAVKLAPEDIPPTVVTMYTGSGEEIGEMALGRTPTDPCERGTVGCSVAHRGSESCATW